jgi:hypothetical protein
MRAVVIALLLAACEREHELTLQYGPDPETISRGFFCQPLVPSPPFELRLVVELLDVGPTMPICLSESLALHCAENVCPVVARRCSELGTVTMQDLADPKALARERLALVSDAPLVDDAPDRPSVVRAVVTTQACDDPAIMQLDTRLASPDVLGCIASCPFLPDEIEGPLVLGLDTDTTTCFNEIRGCANL